MGVTLDRLGFSNGRSLTQWLVGGGAPALPEGHRYTLFIETTDGVTHVTANILSGSELLSQYTAQTRVNVAMAAVSAATYAFEESSL